jgi:type II restriction/modification system DNA methylase subunit YeeA
MNTKDLKAYAPKARRDFIAAVTKQAQKYGVTETVIHPVEINGDVCVVNGNPFPASMASRINKLGERVKSNGFEQTMEQVAYSWFNRLIAIRYMELHDYLGHGRRVLSHPEHPTGFQILEECTELTYGNSGEAGELPDLTHERVVELKLDGTKDEELYRELLLAQCHALHKAMPFLFETIDDETELLLPENLTKTDSLIHDLITDLAESDWESIEVVGWLYQFYISEKKDEVIGKVVKSEDIPAATQLFTPNWIVKYMVQNSLGAQWLATYPESPLKAQMEYYIEPAEQTDEVNAQLKAITPESLNPEELTLIDPASGSGHILVEAYDLFKAIYLERGYRQRDIAQHILEKNLFGLDIDQRAAQLTGFAVMMKGREDDRRLFERGVKLNVMAILDSTNLEVDTLVHGIDLSQFSLSAEDLIALKELFEHATTFGSLIQVPELLAEKLPALKQLSEINSQDMFVKEVLERLAPLVMQAEILAAQYYAVVANPPYMGSGGMNSTIKVFAKGHYEMSKSDLFSCFIERGFDFLKKAGFNAMVTMQSWMFLSSFKSMRENILKTKSIHSISHMENGVMGISFGTCAAIIRNFKLPDYIASYSYTAMSDLNRQLIPIEFPAKNDRFKFVSQKEFMKIPGNPLAYWVSKSFFNSFSTSIGDVRDFAEAEGKNVTTDNERFVRFWWEVQFPDVGRSPKKWFSFAKGGPYRKWFGNEIDVVDWSTSALEHYRAAPAGRLIKSEYWFMQGITWSKVTSGRPSFRLLDTDQTYQEVAVLFTEKNRHQLSPVLGLLNSIVAENILAVISPTLNYQLDDICRIPWQLKSDDTESALIVSTLIELSKVDSNSIESALHFSNLPLLRIEVDTNPTIQASYTGWTAENKNSINVTKTLEEKNNNLFIDAYGLQNELSAEVSIEQITLTVNPAYRYGIKDSEEERNTRFREDTMEELVSYAIGCMMGRYSLDEPGLIYANSGNEGFDASRYISFPADDDGIVPLTDKEWFADDAANRLVEFISVAWDASHLEENLNFLAANLSPKKGEDSRDTIRRYLCDKFYKDHMQTYKKRPIYWLFSSGKQKAFQCLVYLHRYNESTLARMRTEYVIPLTAKLSSHIEKLENDKDASGSAAEIKKLEKEIKNLHKQQTELTEFDEKLKHYADMRIPLDLDDGVKVNYGKFGDLLSDVKAIHGKAV